MSSIVIFQDTAFDIIDINSVPWLRGYQIGTALQLKQPAVGVRKIFSRHRSEFTAEMTAVMELPTAGGPQLVRLFSPRGAALIAMLANTEQAAAFRVWVLDTLEAKALTVAPTGRSLVPIQALLATTAKSLVRYRMMGLNTSECSRLLQLSPSTIRRMSALLRKGGFLPQGGDHA